MEKKYISTKNKIIFILCSIIQKIFTLVLPLCIEKVIDAVIDEQYSKITLYGMKCVMITLVLIVCMTIANYSASTYEEGIIICLRKKFINKIKYISLDNLAQKKIGYYTQRFQSDIECCQQFFLRKPVNLVINIVYSVAIVMLMIRINLKYALLTILPFPVLSLLYVKLSRNIENLTNESEKYEDQIDSRFNEFITCAENLRLFNAEDWYSSKINVWFDNRFKTQKKICGIETVYDMFLITGILNIVTTAVYVLGGMLAFHNIITIGSITAMSLYYSKLWSPLEFFLDYPKSYASYKIHKERIDEVLNICYDVKVHETCDKMKCIVMHDLSVSFDNRKVLNNIDLKIRYGDKIFLSGNNGSGKTTLAKIIAAIADEYDGSISYNHINYNTIDSNSLHKHICMVPSKAKLLSLSVADNINIGYDKALSDLSIKVLQDNNIDPDMLVNEGGSNLSGGEAKLIQILQCLEKEADLYILDEPLNFVDEKHVKVIIALIQNYLSDRTLLIISHDTRIAKVCNISYKLDNGSLIKMET